jgi:DNA repair protein RadC
MKETAKAILEQMNFPNQYDVIREEAERFQKLSGIEKLRSIAELMAMGSRMVNNNPQRQQVLELQNADEDAWREAQFKVFSKYEAKHGSLVS